MIKKKLSHIISFNKTIDAMAFEEYCLKHNVNGRLIPLPKEISAGCGLAWKCEVDEKAIIEKALSEASINYDKMSEILI